MKRFFLTLMAAVVALIGAASQRFYIEDFSISPGQTVTVAIQLDNDVEFTAFQADIYLPDGLTAVNGSFALTSRKSASHTLSAIPQADGALRLMSYSMQLSPYSGNSGSLVKFDVTASEDFAGGVIGLRGILCTTVMGIEYTLENEVCNVNLPVTVLRGDVDMDGNVSISDATSLIDYILDIEVSPFSFDNSDVDGDGKVSIADVTTLVDMILM